MRGVASSALLRKKLRKRSSARHALACRNLAQRYMRPGRESAGSSRSRWSVVARRRRPPAATTPSNALRSLDGDSESMLRSLSVSLLPRRRNDESTLDADASTGARRRGVHGRAEVRGRVD
jgi:hypothetical protein